MTTLYETLSSCKDHVEFSEQIKKEDITALAPKLISNIISKGPENFQNIKILEILLKHIDIGRIYHAFDHRVVHEYALLEEKYWALPILANAGADFSILVGLDAFDWIIHRYNKIENILIAIEKVYPYNKKEFTAQQILDLVQMAVSEDESTTKLRNFMADMPILIEPDVAGETLWHKIAKSKFTLNNRLTFEGLCARHSVLEDELLLEQLKKNPEWIISYAEFVSPSKMKESIIKNFDVIANFLYLLNKNYKLNQFLDKDFLWSDTEKVQKYLAANGMKDVQSNLDIIKNYPDVATLGDKTKNLIRGYYFFLNEIDEDIKVKIFETFKEKLKKEAELTVTEQKVGEHELYTSEEFERFKKYVADNDNNDVAKKYFKSHIPGMKLKRSSKASDILAVISQLYERFPHFEEVTTHIERILQLQIRGTDEFFIPPILMTGGAGIGKTFYTHQLAKIAGTYFGSLSMESVTGSFVISGSDSQWSGAKAGFIFETLKNSQEINPVILLDELDKTITGNYPPINTLLPLLERYTAKRFQDECVPLMIDASRINWFATANDVGSISTPIRSRFDAFAIANPNLEQKKSLIKGVYETILQSNSWGHHMSSNISSEVLGALAEMGDAARDIRRSITIACSRAVVDGKNEIHMQHLDAYKQIERMPWEI